MFDRFILASSCERIMKKYNLASLPEGETYVPSYNIAPNDNAYVLLLEPNRNSEALPMTKAQQSFFPERRPVQAIRSFKFGLDGVEHETKYFIRSEGNRNLQNDPHYSGSKAIFLDNKYKRIIREQRCLVLADAFIINIETKPFLAYLRDHQRPFGMAGLYNVVQGGNGFKTHSFGIITTVANDLIRKLGNDRMPVIVTEYQIQKWLSKQTQLSDVLGMLKPYSHKQMNAYQISDKIKDIANNDLSVIQPISERVYQKKVEFLPQKPKKKFRGVNSGPWWGQDNTEGSDK